MVLYLVVSNAVSIEVPLIFAQCSLQFQLKYYLVRRLDSRQAGLIETQKLIWARVCGVSILASIPFGCFQREDLFFASLVSYRFQSRQNKRKHINKQIDDDDENSSQRCLPWSSCRFPVLGRFCQGPDGANC